jgi:hypothetical protein
LENRAQLVKAIRAAPNDIEAQIDLGKRRQGDS